MINLVSVSVPSESEQSVVEPNQKNAVTTDNETEKTDIEEVNVVEKARPHPTKRAHSWFLHYSFQFIMPTHSSVLSTSQQPNTPEFIQGSSRDMDLCVDQLSQQLQHSASFIEDPDSMWVRDSREGEDIFEF